MEELAWHDLGYYPYLQSGQHVRKDQVSHTQQKKIPVSDKRTAGKIVEQIIRYEKEPPQDPNYYRRMTFAVYFQDRQAPEGTGERAYIKTLESIRQHLLTLGFDIDRIYVSDTPNPQRYLDGTIVPADVRAAIVNGDTATYMMISNTSAGQMVIGHRDHGGPDGWAHPSFNNNHLEAVVSRYPSILYSINCLTGQYDRNPHDSSQKRTWPWTGEPPR